MIDQTQLTDAILAVPASPLAREEGARLAQYWLEHLEEFPESKWKVVAVEVPWYVQIKPKTYIVGQIDGVFDDGTGLVFAEWKSRRAPKIKKDGGNYAGDDEDGWLGEISNGPQLGVYALAGREGKFRIPADHSEIDAATWNAAEGNFPSHEWRAFQIPEPRILVRAAIKSTPADHWPKQWEKGLFTFPGAILDTMRNALLSEAASIRARRKLWVVPWQVPGMHCTNMYRRVCEYYETVCSKRLTPPAEVVGFHHPSDASPDPGYVVCKLLGLDPKDPELVVLSQSALQVNYQCAEKARIDYGGYFPKGEAFELEAGSVLHAACANIYEQLQRECVESVTS